MSKGYSDLVEKKILEKLYFYGRMYVKEGIKAVYGRLEIMGNLAVNVTPFSWFG